MDIVELSKEELRHIALVGTHLHSYQAKTSSAIKNIIKQQGMIQYDPLNPVGRYHDHFLLSRIENYKKGDFEKIVYKNKLIFEYYNPNLCAISIDFFPLFWPLMKQRALRPYYQNRIEKLNKLKPNMLGEVYDYVKANGKTTGKDLSHLGKAHKEFASWKSNQSSSSALEYLWVMGRLTIVERNAQFQKTYNLIENYIPKKYRYEEGKSDDDLQIEKLLVAHKSYPIIKVGKIDKTTDFINFKKKHFIKNIPTDFEHFLLATLPNSDIHYIVPNNYHELLAIEPFDEHMRLIGVLDPLIWDRDLLKLLFNFEYTWEVYKKEKDRIWGYYVFPLLFKGKLIGRIECKLMKEKELPILKIFNLQVESHIKITKVEKTAFALLIERLRKMVSVDTVSKDTSVKKLL